MWWIPKEPQPQGLSGADQRKENFVELNQAVFALSFMTLHCRMLVTLPSAASPPTVVTLKP